MISHKFSCCFSLIDYRLFYTTFGSIYGTITHVLCKGLSKTLLAEREIVNCIMVENQVMLIKSKI